MPLQDFAVEVDGKKAEAQLKSQTVQIGPPAMGKTQTTKWMVWPMEFGPAAEKKVMVNYWAPPVRGDRWTSYEVRRGRPTIVVDDWVNVDHTTLPDDVKARVATYSSGYVLRTGAGWHGKIGKAVIRMHYGEELRKGWLEFLGKASGKREREWIYDAKEGVEKLTLEEFEPDAADDIVYQFRGAAKVDQLKLLEEGLAKGQLDAESRILVLGHVRKEAQALAPQQARERLMPVLEHVVPPLGAPIDVATLNPRLEDELQKVFNELMTEESSNQQLMAIAKANIAFIDELVRSYGKRYDKKWADNRGRHWAEERKRAEMIEARARENLIPQ